VLKGHAQTEVDTTSTPPATDTLASQIDSVLFITNPSVQSDRVIVGKENGTMKPHSPRKATILSAVLPGLGQAYNRKYWKIPIIYAGLGVSVYFLQDNLTQISYFRESYKFATDDNPATINTSGYSAGQLQDLVIQHRKWRDYSYLGMAAIYLLNLVDANVDGHLFNFDVSDDLSLRISPSMLPTAQPIAGLSLCLKL
jgi:hypothetical protein